MAIDNPASLGFDSEGYNLPEIEYIEHIIKVENLSENLFGMLQFQLQNYTKI
jgi:hypothetical protein